VSPASARIDVATTPVDDCWNRIGVRGDGSCEQLPQHVHCRNCPVYANAAGRLLDAPLPPDYRAHWTRHLALTKSSDDAADTQSLMVFRLRNEWLALPTSMLDEIAGMRVIHSLPHRRGGAVLGVVNVRGELRSCVSLARLLGLHDAVDAADARLERLLVLRHDEHCVAMPVDEVHGVQRYHPRQLQEKPATLALAKASHIKALLPWQQRSIGLLDAHPLFNAIDRSLASASAT